MVDKGLIANSMLEADDNRPFLNNPDWLNRNVVDKAAQYKRSLVNPFLIGVSTNSGTAVSAVFVPSDLMPIYKKSPSVDGVEGYGDLLRIEGVNLPRYPALSVNLIEDDLFVSSHISICAESHLPTIDLLIDDFGTVITDEHTYWDAKNWKREELPGSILNIILSSRSPSAVGIKKDKSISVDELISRLDRSIIIPYGTELAKRVRSLRDAANEEYQIQAPITGKSLEGLVNFLSQNSEVKMPEIVLYPNGNVRAQWGNSLERFFGVEFVSGYSGKYVVFTKDSKYSEEMFRSAGESLLETLFDNLSNLDIKDWVIRDGEAEAA